ncbi:MAG TPA: tetratricopeptide repeat protein [Thermoanaerobaculia bacterium]|nr:tetratricopeptide repeat protein [Thermoanaerobaculia bacterium]
MTRIHHALAAVLLLGAGFAGMLAASGEGRILGTVTDGSGAPVAGAKVLITSPEFKYNLEKTTDDKGKFTLIILDATRKYQIRIEKAGFAPMDEPLQPKVGENLRFAYTLQPASAAPAPAAGAPAPAVPAPPSGTSQAVTVYNDGVVSFQAGDMAAAIAKFQKAAELDPKQSAAQGALADVYISQGKFAEAAAAADRYLELEPGKPRGLRDRYDAYKGMGDKAKAKQALEALIAADPGHDTAVRVFNEGVEYAHGGQTEAAVADLKRALTLDKRLEAAHTALADIDIQRKDYPAALEEANRMLEFDSQSTDAMRVRSDVYRRMSEEAKAQGNKAKVKEYDAKSREALAAISKSNPNGTADTLFRKGVALFNNNKISEARAAFEQVLTLDPNHARANYMLGMSCANEGDTAKAKEYLTKFLELAPNDPEAKAAKEMLQYMQ